METNINIEKKPYSNNNNKNQAINFDNTTNLYGLFDEKINFIKYSKISLSQLIELIKNLILSNNHLLNLFDKLFIDLDNETIETTFTKNNVSYAISKIYLILHQKALEKFYFYFNIKLKKENKRKYTLSLKNDIETNSKNTEITSLNKTNKNINNGIYQTNNDSSYNANKDIKMKKNNSDCSNNKLQAFFSTIDEESKDILNNILNYKVNAKLDDLVKSIKNNLKLINITEETVDMVYNYNSMYFVFSIYEDVIANLIKIILQIIDDISNKKDICSNDLYLFLKILNDASLSYTILANCFRTIIHNKNDIFNINIHKESDMYSTNINSNNIIEGNKENDVANTIRTRDYSIKNILSPDYYNKIVFFGSHSIKSKLEKVYHISILGNASISKGFEDNNTSTNKVNKKNLDKNIANKNSIELLPILSSGFYMTYYFFAKEDAYAQNTKFAVKPSLEIAKKVWNLLDTDGIKHIIELSQPKIYFRKEIFILKGIYEESSLFKEAFFLNNNSTNNFNNKAHSSNLDFIKELSKKYYCCDKCYRESNYILNINNQLLDYYIRNFNEGRFFVDKKEWKNYSKHFISNSNNRIDSLYDNYSHNKVDNNNGIVFETQEDEVSNIVNVCLDNTDRVLGDNNRSSNKSNENNVFLFRNSNNATNRNSKERNNINGINEYNSFNKKYLSTLMKIEDIYNLEYSKEINDYEENINSIKNNNKVSIADNNSNNIYKSNKYNKDNKINSSDLEQNNSNIIINNNNNLPLDISFDPRKASISNKNISNEEKDNENENNDNIHTIDNNSIIKNQATVKNKETDINKINESNKKVFFHRPWEYQISHTIKNFYLRTKLLYTDNLILKERDNNTFIKSIKTTFKSLNCFPVEQNLLPKNLMIHVHGGGFVAMSSTSHENYLRKWSNNLNIPIISFDYKLSPESKFPEALNDIFKGYIWLLNHAKEELGIDPQRIILTGDSAGGNLCASLVILLIINSIRLPDLLFLSYPALRLDMDYFSPSYLNFLSDVILPYHLVKFCFECYLNDKSLNYTGKNNPFISPILMDDFILEKFPATRIICGTKDPLRDESVRMIERMERMGKDAKLIEFEHFPHGFLNFDYPMMMSGMDEVQDVICCEMKKFLL